MGKILVRESQYQIPEILRETVRKTDLVQGGQPHDILLRQSGILKRGEPCKELKNGNPQGIVVRFLMKNPALLKFNTVTKMNGQNMSSKASTSGKEMPNG